MSDTTNPLSHEDPAGLLASAVGRINAADFVLAGLDEDLTSEERLGYTLDAAFALATIAKAAIEVREHEDRGKDKNPGVFNLDDFEDAERPEPADDGPHAVGLPCSVTFVADEVGLIGNRRFVFVRYTGWIDVTDLQCEPDPVRGGVVHVGGRGRAVSRYNGQLLFITDAGVGMVLPAELVTPDPR